MIFSLFLYVSPLLISQIDVYYTGMACMTKDRSEFQHLNKMLILIYHFKQYSVNDTCRDTCGLCNSNILPCLQRSSLRRFYIETSAVS